MNHKVGAVTEGFPTVLTLIRLLSCVDSLVHSEVGTLTEGFSTLSAHKLSPFSLPCCGGREQMTTLFTLLVSPFGRRLAVFECLFELSCLSPHPLQLGHPSDPSPGATLSLLFLLNLLPPLQHLCGILLGVKHDSGFQE